MTNTFQDGYGDQLPLYMILSNTNRKKNTLTLVKTEVAKLAGGMLALG
jgi:hypothetical protein